MFGAAAGIFSKMLGVNDVGDLFTKIYSCFTLTPEQKAQMETLKLSNVQELQKLQLELESKAQDALSTEVQAASANIRAEASSGDKFTSRARPGFLYVCYAVLLNNYILLPYTSLHGGKPIDFPDMLFWLMGSCILGYTGARSWEKFQTMKGGA